MDNTMPQVFMGIDPSYRRTGISIYNKETDTLTITRVENKELNKDKTFENIYHDAKKQIDIIMEIVDKFKVTHILSEVPPPTGAYSSGLYGLDFILMDRLYYKVQSISVVSPSYIGFIHGTRKYNKIESSILGRKILDTINVKNIITTSKRVAHDEYESLIFLSRLLCKNNILRDKLTDISVKFVMTKEKTIK